MNLLSSCVDRASERLAEMFTFLLFDVGHGFCAYANTPSRDDILFDCGYDNELQFYPSRYFLDRNITYVSNLTISHYDQDHIAILPELRKAVTFGALSRNASIPTEFIKRRKSQTGGITAAMESAIDMHSNWIHPLSDPPTYGGVKISRFSNKYPKFTDMNNLSLVTFLEYDGCGIVVPGDLEYAGWMSLLELEAFQLCLKRTTIFIASHHGRNAGYCEEVFDHCKPEIILLSDKNIVHDSQEHDYTKHASGIKDTEGASTRWVLTTRSDGHILIEKELGQPVLITRNYEL